MQKNSQLNNTLLVIGFVAGAAILRLLLTGTFPNFSPVAAMALFGGVYFRDKRMALVLPLAVMFLTDLSLEIAYQVGWREYTGFHPVMPFVYAGFLITVLIGMAFKNNVKPLPLVGAGLLSSTVFFILTNFGVWATGGYPQTVDGLLTCYVAAIPFFHYSVAGDLFFIGVLFGGFELVKSRYLAPSASRS